jgi:hypothetical protein
VDIAFVVDVRSVDLADFATDPPGFRVPTHVIADLECFGHGLASIVCHGIFVVPTSGQIEIFLTKMKDHAGWFVLCRAVAIDCHPTSPNSCFSIAAFRQARTAFSAVLSTVLNWWPRNSPTAIQRLSAY